jgi:hypothetical protein
MLSGLFNGKELRTELVTESVSLGSELQFCGISSPGSTSLGKQSKALSHHRPALILLISRRIDKLEEMGGNFRSLDLSEWILKWDCSVWLNSGQVCWEENEFSIPTWWKENAPDVNNKFAESCLFKPFLKKNQQSG